MNVGFIGLGTMGSGMAKNLLTWLTDQGHTLQVFDLNPNAVADLVSQGALAHESVASTANQCDLVFTSSIHLRHC